MATTLQLEQPTTNLYETDFTCFEISGVLKDSPSLRRCIPEMLVDAWARARDEAEEETGIKADTFPEGCPWDVDGKILSGWLPE
ncbi:DUF29 family protein [Acidithiobacillus ferrianus]|uniref:DUF29 family protein n=2 Tax=Acidithiobacillus ferrianus TaxID=2678518 RepID=A0A845U5Z8_9PROT|nr:MULTISPECIES: DUF29 family protein [Acidithiobacillus]NDU41241.1 DUF29 family protein [Acidithiobacillus ferrianus]